MKGKYAKAKAAPQNGLVLLLSLIAALLAVLVGMLLILRPQEPPQIQVPPTIPSTLAPETRIETQPELTEATQTLPVHTTAEPERLGEITVPTTHIAETAAAIDVRAQISNAAASPASATQYPTARDDPNVLNLPGVTTATTPGSDHVHILVDIHDGFMLGASCTAYGKKYQTCTKCNYITTVLDDTKPPLGHREDTRTVPPEIGVQGYTEHYCTRCDAVLYTDSYVPPLEPPSQPVEEPPVLPADDAPAGEQLDTQE